MPLIVCEGMDNSGKSTLVKRIHAIAPRRTWLLSSRDVGTRTINRTEVINKLIAQAVYNDEYEFNVLLDRVSVISEEIYGPLIRGYSAFGLSWEPMFEDFVKLQPTVIYCRPPREVILGNIEDRPQMEGVKDHASELLGAYDRFMTINIVERVPSRDFYVYDYIQDPQADELLNNLKERGQIMWENLKF